MIEALRERSEAAIVPELQRDTIIAHMQEIAPVGVSNLDDVTIEKLRNLTGVLVDIQGKEAQQEYSRYITTSGRELELPTNRLHEQLAGKTILITGGTGIIGSTLMQEILKYNPGRLISVSIDGNENPYSLVDGAEYLEADIRNKKLLDDIMQTVRPDIVYHVAADKYNGEAESRVRHTLSTNIIGTKNVLEAAKEAGAQQFVYASTGKASRPYSKDVYASSKKVGEALLSDAAATGDMLCSAARFTHVADNSYFCHKLNRWIQNNEVIRLHGAEIWFYVQSAKESAQLLLNAGLEAKPGELRINAIRDLGLPVNLTDLAVGAIARKNTSGAIYFSGFSEGYEEKYWPGLYDPANAGDVSVLINSLEAPETEVSATCPAVDVFPFRIEHSNEVSKSFDNLRTILSDQTKSSQDLRTANEDLGAQLLKARMHRIPAEVVARAATRVKRFQSREGQTLEHRKINRAIIKAAFAQAG